MKREGLIEKRDLLLFDILQELKKLNSRQGETTKGEVGSVLQPEVKKYPCKYCGGEHDKPQLIGVCARKLKQKKG